MDLRRTKQFFGSIPPYADWFPRAACRQPNDHGTVCRHVSQQRAGCSCQRAIRCVAGVVPSAGRDVRAACKSKLSKRSGRPSWFRACRTAERGMLVPSGHSSVQNLQCRSGFHWNWPNLRRLAMTSAERGSPAGPISACWPLAGDCLTGPDRCLGFSPPWNRRIGRGDAFGCLPQPESLQLKMLQAWRCTG